MRAWRGRRRPRYGFTVLSPRPRHSGSGGAQPADPRVPGRSGVRDHKRRASRFAVAGSLRRTTPRHGRPSMNAPTKIKAAFDPKAARADFEILSRQVYGKPLVYLDSAA